jgi:hypothetical protein
MTTPTYNLLAVRKTIGAIRHRAAEPNLDPLVRDRIIARQWADLADTLPPSFNALLKAQDLDSIEAALPPLTYGCTLQGQVFEVAGRGLYRKNKAGRVELLTGTILPHFPADLPVALLDN